MSHFIEGFIRIGIKTKNRNNSNSSSKKSKSCGLYIMNHFYIFEKMLEHYILHNNLIYARQHPFSATERTLESTFKTFNLTSFNEFRILLLSTQHVNKH